LTVSVEINITQFEYIILYSPIDLAANKQNTKQEFEKKLESQTFFCCNVKEEKNDE